MLAIERGRETLGTFLGSLIGRLDFLRGRRQAVAAAMAGVLSPGDLRLRGAVGAMEDGFGLFDAEDRIVLHNAAFM
ncbi:MAG TPA: hypothetical protein PLR41_14865, partial [Alphaproteobacteria bacterium]|nr:hypothetical protein [Alphaproteobacteria bacterium]